jgi:hypothetical protein
MKSRRRTRRQRGGNKDIAMQHSISQLKRFVLRAKEGSEFKSLQFGYNLGRLQEMVDPLVSGAQKYWWSPVEALVIGKNWDELLALIEKMRTEKLHVEYDVATVDKA